MPTVTLRPVTIEQDLDHIMTWVNDPEVMKNFANFSKPITREQEQKFLEETLSQPTERLFSIEDVDGTYVGQIAINKIYWPARTGRLGTIIGNKEKWGQGYAQAAITAILPIAFEQLGLNKVWVVFYATNQRMRHICEKIGFKHEGVQREEYYHNGSYHDMIRMSLLKREYETSNLPTVH